VLPEKKQTFALFFLYMAKNSSIGCKKEKAPHKVGQKDSEFVELVSDTG
jgi:hypothetical protein